MFLGKTRRRLKVALREAIMGMGVDLHRHSADRRLLEKHILPYLAALPTTRKVLFIGCDWYTRGYRKLFAQQDYWTLDFDPDKQRFGASQHIVASMTDLAQHFADDSLDVIVCNGVFGYGLDEPDAVTQAFSACYDCLRSGGILVIGWNDTPERRPFDPLTSPGLQRFKPYIFPSTGSARVLVPVRTRHTYDFLIK